MPDSSRQVSRSESNWFQRPVGSTRVPERVVPAISPLPWSFFRASRTVVRLTLKLSHSSASVGSVVPGARSPATMRRPSSAATCVPRFPTIALPLAITPVFLSGARLGANLS